MTVVGPDLCEPTLSTLIGAATDGTLLDYATGSSIATYGTGATIAGYKTMASIISYATAEKLLACFISAEAVLLLEDSTVLSDITYLEG